MGKDKRKAPGSSVTVGEAALFRLMLFPEDCLESDIMYPNCPNTEKFNPQGGEEVFTPNWSQTGPAVFPSTHRCAGLTVNDLSNDAMQLFIAIFGDATNAMICENKNTQGTVGKDVPYRLVSPEGTYNFILPLTMKTAGVAPITVELKPISAVYDISALVPFQAATAANFCFNVLPNGFPTTTAGTMSAHGLILPYAEWDAHHGIWLDESGVSSGAAVGPVNGVSTAISQAQAQALSSAAYCIDSGEDLSVGGPVGWQPWATNDTLSLQMYQFNEDDGTETTWNIVITIVAAQGGATGYRVPLAFFPTNGSDYCYFVASAESVAAPTNTPVGNQVLRRSLCISMTSCGGIFEHHMAPYMNDRHNLGMWTSTMSLGASIRFPNWTANYGKGGIGVVRQGRTNTYWQAQGLDQQLPGGAYQFNATVGRGEQEIVETKFGERMWLGITGRPSLFFQHDIDNVSQKLNFSGYGTVPPAQFNVKFSARARTYGVQVLKSPGTGANAAAGGIQPAQAFEGILAHKWTGISTDEAIGIMEQKLPYGFSEAEWNAAATRAATMLRGGPTDSVSMEYYLNSENWQMKKQDGLWNPDWKGTIKNRHF